MSSQILTPQQAAVLTRLVTNLEFYAKSCLKIIDKQGLIRPLVLNRAQMVLHALLEKQKRDTGMVRAVVLKGRQQGCTTYLQARYFHQTSFRSNLSAYVLAHQVESDRKSVV